MTLEQIVDAVCDHYETTAKEVRGKSRKGEIVNARRAFCHMAYFFTDKSTAEIGEYISSDHSTVIHHRERYWQLLELESWQRQKFQEIKKSIIRRGCKKAMNCAENMNLDSKSVMLAK